jgi:hypothetical protein
MKKKPPVCWILVMTAYIAVAFGIFLAVMADPTGSRINLVWLSWLIVAGALPVAGYALYRVWRYPVEDEQLAYLRVMLNSDHKWMSVGIPVVKELTERYMGIASPEWRSLPVEPVEKLRDRLRVISQGGSV